MIFYACDMDWVQVWTPLFLVHFCQVSKPDNLLWWVNPILKDKEADIRKTEAKNGLYTLTCTSNIKGKQTIYIDIQAVYSWYTYNAKMGQKRLKCSSSSWFGEKWARKPIMQELKWLDFCLKGPEFSQIDS